jgi:hypothetical protein
VKEFSRARKNSSLLFRLLVFCVFLPCISEAQELVRGIVVDSASFAALPNVSIKVKHSFRGTTTDIKGNFAIHVSETDTLIFSILGYKRLEFPLFGYEAGMIRLSEQSTMLAPIDIYDTKIYKNPYDGLFDEEHARLKKRIPFYYSKARKDRVKAANWREEAQVVRTYVDVVINNPETKDGLMKRHELSEEEYYNLLTKFNEKHYEVMYFLTSGELISLINKFFEAHAPVR